ncbi:MAG: hypothetical protein WC764_04370 [Candidatus Paceibacterota bacterium]|jgi:hypothetical protein
MTRETKTLKTPAGKEFILNCWLTAREARELKEITFKHIKFGMENVAGRDGVTQSPTMKEYDAAATMREKDEATIRLLVISYDGNVENILERLLDSPASEWDSVLSAANEIVLNPTEPKLQ